MRTGILGFQSARLKQLRASTGMTQAKLAELLSCSTSNISKWEKGDSFPESSSFKKICETFGVSEKWLLESPVRSGDARPGFFRTQVSTCRGAKDSAEARLEWLEEVSYKLQESLEFPDINIPSYGGGDVRLIQDCEIEQLAEECRDRWGLGRGPISDVVHVLESFGVVVARSEIGYVKMDGVSRWSAVDDRPYVLLASDKAGPIRSRFDAAHELGHLVLHRGIGAEQYKANYHLLETQAHRFASAFLMPAESFSHEIKWPTLDAFLSLKSRWKVSIAAMIKRSQDLEISSHDVALRLWKARSARGWVKKEPLDDDFEFELPKLLKRSVMMLVEHKILSKDTLRDVLGAPVADLEELCCLPSGYFSAIEKDQVVDIRLRQKEQRKSAFEGGKSSTVLQFPSR